jgi:predicted nucleic acid-binding Zn ribbon protein
MATYEYKCEDNHVYIDERPMTADEGVIPPCDICTKEMKRVYSSAVGIIFNAPGFYSSRR